METKNYKTVSNVETKRAQKSAAAVFRGGWIPL